MEEAFGPNAVNTLCHANGVSMVTLSEVFAPGSEVTPQEIIQIANSFARQQRGSAACREGAGSPTIWGMIEWHDMYLYGILRPDMPHSEIVHVGPQGRIVIPASIRRELHLKEGSELRVVATGGRLVLEPPAEILARLRRRFAEIPSNVSLADELSAKRRREATRELAE